MPLPEYLSPVHCVDNTPVRGRHSLPTARGSGRLPSNNTVTALGKLVSMTPGDTGCILCTTVNSYCTGITYNAHSRLKRGWKGGGGRKE